MKYKDVLGNVVETILKYVGHVLIGVLLLSWWVIITITLPVWMLIFSIGVWLGATDFRTVFELIWNGFYKLEIMEDN